MSPTLFQAFLDQLALLYEIPNLRPDKKGACQLFLKKENLFVLFEYDELIVAHTILLSTPLGEITTHHTKTLMEELLQENQKSDYVFSIQPDTPICFLHTRCVASLQQEELQIMLSSFTEKAKKWSTKILNPEKERRQSNSLFPYEKV